ncbi:MAG: hypothetical protein QM601_06330 [Pseudoxanthomonas sp.]
MAIKSVATLAPAPSLVDAARNLFGEYPLDVIAVIEHGSERFFQLASLFEAIAASADKYGRVRHLAELGGSVANDAGNFLDERREEYTDAVKKATATHDKAA